MMQVIPRWKVTITLASGSLHVFWISDAFPENVLRAVAMMQFSENGLIQPRTIVVTEDPNPQRATE